MKGDTKDNVIHLIHHALCSISLGALLCIQCMSVHMAEVQDDASKWPSLETATCDFKEPSASQDPVCEFLVKNIHVSVEYMIT